MEETEFSGDSGTASKEDIIEFHTAISNHNFNKVSEMFAKNKLLANSYLDDIAVCEEIYPENQIDFDGGNDLGITPLIGIGLRGSAATAELLLSSATVFSENDLVKALCLCAIKDNHEVAIRSLRSIPT